jgi:hypothetical protein
MGFAPRKLGMRLADSKRIVLQAARRWQEISGDVDRDASTIEWSKS